MEQLSRTASTSNGSRGSDDDDASLRQSSLLKLVGAYHAEIGGQSTFYDDSNAHGAAAYHRPEAEGILNLIRLQWIHYIRIMGAVYHHCVYMQASSRKCVIRCSTRYSLVLNCSSAAFTFCTGMSNPPESAYHDSFNRDSESDT